MKNSVLLLACLFSVTLAKSQVVDADEIMRKAKNGEDIRYENVTVRGVVDLTPWLEERDDLPRKSWFSMGDNQIENTMRGKITFINCQFDDDFLAYYYDDRSEFVFVSHFDRDVVFKNCTFKRDAAFKYSEFEGDVDFSNSTFNDDVNFKYAEFDDQVSFANTSFDEDADFKYAEFDESVDFSKTRFDETANFKYAEMRNGVKFTDAVFDGFWDLKYAEMDDEVDLSGINVNHDLDTKYTKINGKGFNRYLLSGND